MTRQWDLMAATAAAALLAIVALAAPVEAVRLCAAVPLCLFLPGYAIAAAGWGARQIQLSTLLVLSVALSLGTLAAGVLILNLVPGGITAASWTVLLFAVVLVGSLVAARRRPRPVGGIGLRLRLSIADGALLVAALAVFGGALALASTPLPAENAEGYTRLWMLPRAGGGTPAVLIGVDSNEQDSVSYELQVKRDKGPSHTVSRFTLEPGEERVMRLAAKRPLTSKPVRVTARLFRDEEPTVPYRRVTGWIPGA